MRTSKSNWEEKLDFDVIRDGNRVEITNKTFKIKAVFDLNSKYDVPEEITIKDINMLSFVQYTAKMLIIVTEMQRINKRIKARRRSENL